MSTVGPYTHLLKIANPAALHEFLHECIDDLLEKRCANFENYNNGDIEWTEEDFERARTYIQNLYRQSTIDNCLELPKHMTTDLQEAITHCYKIRKNDIFQMLARECILQNGQNLVNNIDWRIKWILGTSSLATLQEPLLQVDFHCSKKIGKSVIKNTINFEAKLEQIENLIDELSKFQKQFL